MRRILLAGFAVGSIAVLAACGSSNNDSTAHDGMSMSTSMSTPPASGATPASGPHNAADVTFATDMIPHHGKATQMAEMALTKTSNAEIKRLATAIKNAQDPEIETMSGWLAGWGQPVPAATMGSMPGMSMPGMMSDADMAKLEQSSGSAFDRQWVTMMIDHHTGAVDMAKTELSAGQNPDAKQLAQSIITSQSSEIATMRQLLGTLPN